jgi:ABC-type transport system involved in multi-copper enzyme maturation permease subunit
MRRIVQAIFARELLAVVRARSSYVLLASVAAVSFGVVLATGSQPAYVPTAVDLLLPMELLVPAVAIALGYRTIAADDRRGELAVLQTYPVPPWAYVLGVFLGRAVAMAALLAGPLALVGIYVAISPSPGSPLLATHQGVDSPIVFARFVLLTVGFGVAVLAMALAASALARSRPTALVLGIVVLGLVVLGFDLLVVRGFAGGWIGSGQLTTALAASPTSAYRGLVFETVVSTATDSALQQGSVALSAAGLGGWTALSLLVASLAIE